MCSSDLAPRSTRGRAGSLRTWDARVVDCDLPGLGYAAQEAARGSFATTGRARAARRHGLTVTVAVALVPLTTRALTEGHPGTGGQARRAPLVARSQLDEPQAGGDSDSVSGSVTVRGSALPAPGSKAEC